MCSKTDFSPCLCPPWSSVFALVCPLLLAPPSGVCTGWTGCSWWRGVLQTGCVSPTEVNTFKKPFFLFIYFYRKEREKRLFRVFFLTSSLKFLKAATLSSTLSWLRGRSFKRSITWHKQEGAISTTAGIHVKHTVISKTKKKEWVIKGQNQRVVWFYLEIISGGEVKVHRGDLNGTDIHTINHLWF